MERRIGTTSSSSSTSYRSSPSKSKTGFFALCIIISFLIGTQIGSLKSQSSSFWEVIDHPSSSSSSSSISLSINDNYYLAYNESYGYFDTILNDEWMLQKSYIKNITSMHRYTTSPRRHWDKPSLWYYNNFDPIFSCPIIKRVNGIGDGPKWTCDPHRLINIVNRRKLQRQISSSTDASSSSSSDCLIYSVGSNGNYQWEDGMYNILGKTGICEIHIFDYSQNYTRKKNLGRNMHFHQIGLHGSQNIPKNKFMNYFEILQMLNHTNRIIDIFKIDCEGCEWTTYTDWLKPNSNNGNNNIRQILIETHNLPKNKTLGLDFFNSFLENNFYMYSKEVNPWGGGSCVEFSYIKLQI